jgi:hypothetical protein
VLDVLPAKMLHVVQFPAEKAEQYTKSPTSLAVGKIFRNAEFCIVAFVPPCAIGKGLARWVTVT